MATVSSHHSTPVKASAEGTDRFSHIRPQAEANKERYKKEMEGQYVGPMSVDLFFETFMPPVEAAMPAVNFNSVRTDIGVTEKVMYPQIVSRDACICVPEY